MYVRGHKAEPLNGASPSFKPLHDTVPSCPAEQTGSPLLVALPGATRGRIG